MAVLDNYVRFSTGSGKKHFFNKEPTLPILDLEVCYEDKWSMQRIHQPLRRSGKVDINVHAVCTRESSLLTKTLGKAVKSQTVRYLHL